MLKEKDYKKEANPNQYDPEHPTLDTVLRRVNKDWFKDVYALITLDDILQEIINTGGVKETQGRKNAKRPNQPRVKSMTLGSISVWGWNYLTQETTGERWRLFVMICSYATLQHGLDLGEDFTAVCVNHNWRCGPHMDKSNVGNNYIIGFGEYTGGELIVNGKYHDIRHTLLTFDPKQKHEVAEFEGERYTITFFTHKNYNV